MENTRGTNRCRELFSFPYGSRFPASPCTGAKMMLFHSLCFGAWQLCWPRRSLSASDPAASAREREGCAHGRQPAWHGHPELYVSVTRQEVGVLQVTETSV